MLLGYFDVAVCLMRLHVCVSDMAQSFSVVVFHCRHMFHKECLPSSGPVGGSSWFAFSNLTLCFCITLSVTFLCSQIPGMQFCNICSAKKRRPGSGILEMKK